MSFVFISSVLLDNFFDVFSCILTDPRPLIFKLQIVTHGLWNQFSQSCQSLKKLNEMEQKILHCITCRKDKFDLWKFCFSWVLVACVCICVHEGVYMCVYEYRIGIKNLFLTVDCSLKKGFILRNTVLTPFGLIHANLDPITLWLWTLFSS